MPKSKEFVSDSDSDDSQPKEKKKKTETKKASKTDSKASKAKAAASKDEDENMFSLGKMRYATVSEFRGRKMVNIREYYYDADGEMKPGKKGIALSEEQWQKLKDSISSIDEALQ